jgi:hypothetical protein
MLCKFVCLGATKTQFDSTRFLIVSLQSVGEVPQGAWLCRHCTLNGTSKGTAACRLCPVSEVLFVVFFCRNDSIFRFDVVLHCLVRMDLVGFMYCVHYLCLN